MTERDAGLAGQTTMSNLAWGTFFFDADNDGDLDIVINNFEPDAPPIGGDALPGRSRTWEVLLA